MKPVRTRPLLAADVEAVRRLSQRVMGRTPSVKAISKAVNLTGHVGYVAYLNKDAVTGFVLGSVQAPSVRVQWVVAGPEFLELTLASLVNKLKTDYPDFILLFRVPHENYEFVASLRDVTGSLRPVDKRDDNAEFRWYFHNPTPRPAPGDCRSPGNPELGSGVGQGG